MGANEDFLTRKIIWTDHKMLGYKKCCVLYFRGGDTGLDLCGWNIYKFNRVCETIIGDIRVSGVESKPPWQNSSKVSWLF